MAVTGPIIIVEDDLDDQEIIADVIKTLKVGNELIFFRDGKEALVYLETTREKPFVILSDINMPVMNGLELRERIIGNALLKRKSIPFIFLSTTGNPVAVQQAYAMDVQGFFTKQNNLSELQHTLQMVILYWKNCLHPNA